MVVVVIMIMMVVVVTMIMMTMLIIIMMMMMAATPTNLGHFTAVTSHFSIKFSIFPDSTFTCFL
jgi:hypothetical protein